MSKKYPWIAQDSEHKIERLLIDSSSLNLDSFESFIDFLSKNTTLTSLEITCDDLFYINSTQLKYEGKGALEAENLSHLSLMQKFCLSLRNHPTLTRLSLRGCKLTDEDILQLCRLLAFESRILSQEPQQSPKKDYRNTSSVFDIRPVTIDQLTRHLLFPKHWQTFPIIRPISSSNRSSTTSDISNDTHRLNLTSLDLSFVNMSFEASKILSKAISLHSSLTQLNLFRSGLKEAIADFGRCILYHPNISNVNLGMNKFSLASLFQIFSHQQFHLSELSLSKIDMDDQTLLSLLSALSLNPKNLKTLNISSNKLTTSANGLHQAKKFFTKLKSLTSLNLSGNPLYYHSNRADSLTKGQPSSSFIITSSNNDKTSNSSNLLEDSLNDGRRRSNSAFASHEHYRDLNLSSFPNLKSNFTLKNEAGMINYLPNPLEWLLDHRILGLRELDLSSTCLGPDDASWIAFHLEMNSKLTKLNISNNPIGNNGMAQIAEALKWNQVLEDLDASSTLLTDESAQRFSNALIFNMSLKSISLHGNNFSEKSVYRFVEMLNFSNSYLHSAHLGIKSKQDHITESQNDKNTSNEGPVKMNISDILKKLERRLQTNLRHSIARNLSVPAPYLKQKDSLFYFEIPTFISDTEEKWINEMKNSKLMDSGMHSLLKSPSQNFRNSSRQHRQSLTLHEMLELNSTQVINTSLKSPFISPPISLMDQSSSIGRISLVSLGMEDFPEGLIEASPANLWFLDLRKNRLAKIPLEIKKLKKLIVLHLQDNLLDSIPYTVTELDKLEVLSIHKNPLKLIPQGKIDFTELLQSKPLKSTKLWNYLQSEISSKLNSVLEMWRGRMMLVGDENSGRTSLLRSFQTNDESNQNRPKDAVTKKNSGTKSKQKDKSKNKSTTDSNEAQPTSESSNEPKNQAEVEISEITMKYKPSSKTEPIDVVWTCYDFAGETVHTTHSFFISEGIVYLVLFDASKLDDEGLLRIEYWVKSIIGRCPTAYIYIVGTHADLISPSNAKFLKKLEQRMPERSEVIDTFLVSTTNPNFKLNSKKEKKNLDHEAPNITKKMLTIDELKLKLCSKADSAQLMQRKWPGTIFAIQQALKCFSSTMPFLPFESIVCFLYHIGISDVNSMVERLKALGSLMYFGKESQALKNIAFVRPQFLCDIFAMVFTLRNDISSTGRIKISEARRVWSLMKHQVKEKQVWALLETFDVAIRLFTKKYSSSAKDSQNMQFSNREANQSFKGRMKMETENELEKEVSVIHELANNKVKAKKDKQKGQLPAVPEDGTSYQNYPTQDLNSTLGLSLKNATVNSHLKSYSSSYSLSEMIAESSDFKIEIDTEYEDEQYEYHHPKILRSQHVLHTETLKSPSSLKGTSMHTKSNNSSLLSSEIAENNEMFDFDEDAEFLIPALLPQQPSSQWFNVSQILMDEGNNTLPESRLDVDSNIFKPASLKMAAAGVEALSQSNDKPKDTVHSDEAAPSSSKRKLLAAPSFGPASGKIVSSFSDKNEANNLQRSSSKSSESSSSEYSVADLSPQSMATSWFRRIYHFSFLPFGFFSLLISRCLHSPNATIKYPWIRGFVMESGEEIGQVWFESAEKLLVDIRGLPTAPLLTWITQIIDGIIKGWYTNSIRITEIIGYKHPSNPQQIIYVSKDAVLALLRQGETKAKVGLPIAPTKQDSSPPPRSSSYSSQYPNFVRIDAVAPELCMYKLRSLQVDVDDVFKLDKEALARGAFGEVWLANYLDEVVAMKCYDGNVRGRHLPSDYESMTQYHEEVAKSKQKALLELHHEIFVMSALAKTKILRSDEIDHSDQALDREDSSGFATGNRIKLIYHPNLAALKGFSFGPPMLLMENIPFGDLDNFADKSYDAADSDPLSREAFALKEFQRIQEKLERITQARKALRQSLDKINLEVEETSKDSSVNETVEKHTLLPWTHILRVLLDAARAMKWMHSRDPPIIHRDLALNNIMLFNLDPLNFDVPMGKVIDFSISTLMIANQVGSCNNAKIIYLAPEVLNGTWNLKSDVYSFSIIMWQLYTRRFLTKVTEQMVKEGKRPNFTVDHHFFNALPMQERKSIESRFTEYKTKSSVLAKDEDQLRSMFITSYSEGYSVPSPTSKYESVLLFADLMKQCWKPVSDDRPAFDVIAQRLELIFYLYTGFKVPRPAGFE